MTLYSPKKSKEIDLTAPRLHAFVIGVADYPHLMGGSGQPAAVNFGLQQLTTTRHASISIAEFLTSRYLNPDCPLGSLELLLSPSEKLTRSDNTKVTIETSTMANIRAAFKRWYDRCNSQTGNIAFFYFAGHGVSRDSRYLLAADALDPNQLKLSENFINFDWMRLGMRKNAAATQLFFVDACREKPIDLYLQANVDGDSLVDAGVNDKLAATSAAYFAAADGQRAYGPPNEGTYFSTAVIDALNGAAAKKKDGKWAVNTSELGNAINQIMSSLSRTQNLPLTCNSDADGAVATIHFPPGVFVHLTVGCRSAQANNELDIHLQRQAVVVHSPAGDPRPWRYKLEPGDWNLRMNFQTFPSIARSEIIMGPVYELVEPI
jgi:hypothetical protein